MSRSIWSDDTLWRRYYRDLNPLRLAKGLDWRPHTARVSYSSWWQYGDTDNLLTALGIPITNIGWPSSTSWNPATTVTTYRLYAGGARYNVQNIAGTQQNIARQPDVLTNPLGIYFATGSVDLYANATFQGTLIAYGDIIVRGTGVRFDPVSLPPLYGTTTPVQLPVAVGNDDFSVQAGAGVTVNGQVSLSNRFYVATGPQAATPLTFTGQLIAGSLQLDARSEWTSRSDGWWDGQYNSFHNQIDKPTGTPYFPEYLQRHASLDPTPRVVLRPGTSAVRYHWQAWTNAQNAENPVFVPAAGDAGLRWDLLEWTENP
jgi:hypothetical protein